MVWDVWVVVRKVGNNFTLHFGHFGLNVFLVLSEL